MTETTEPKTRKRRTPAEIKAYHLEQISKADEREKVEAVRLLSDAHDTVTEALSLQACKGNAPAGMALTQLKAALAALTPKK